MEDPLFDLTPEEVFALFADAPLRSDELCADLLCEEQLEEPPDDWKPLAAESVTVAMSLSPGMCAEQN